MKRHLSLAITAALLASCSGGGASGGAGGVTPHYQTAKIGITIVVPKKDTKHHHAVRMRDGRELNPWYVSVATQSIVFTLTTVNGGTPPSGYNSTLTVNTSSGGNCGQDTGATGGLVCHGTMTAPVADDGFSVTAYSGSNGTGNILSSNVLTQNIVAGTNTLDLTLSPVVASTNGLAWSTGSASTGNGTAAGNSISLEAKDAAGDIIIATASGCSTNCTTFNTPIYLKADGSTPDYIGWTCNNSALNFYTSSAHTTQANGNGASLADGTSLSSPLSSVSSGTVSAPNGSSVTTIGNNGAYMYYNGTAQTASTSSLTCTATDSQANSATFTLSLNNGSIGWVVN
jgi:hypothetical protein